MPLMLWILLILILILLLVYFGIGAFVALTMTKMGEHPQFDQTPGSFGLDFDSVRFPSREDGLKLAAWFVPYRSADRAIILVHGRNASKQNAISGRLPALAAALHQVGLNVLMLDLRGHGESEGKRYTWGIHERRDVLGALDYLLEKGFTPGKIALLGISLGGAAVIGAAARERAIGAVVVESTFADLIDLVTPNWTKETGLPMFFLPGVYVMWQLLFGFSPHDVKPVEEIAWIAPRPVLILHSKADEMIPISHAQRLAEAAPQAELILFDGCDHAELYRDCPQDYLDALLNFFEARWGKKQNTLN